MKSSAYLAVDMGAESGRVISGSITENRLQLKEIHRFQNRGVRLNEHLYWDILNLWREIKRGLYLADTPVRSIGLDTWGVDFGLLDRHDTLVENPYHYRDKRTDGIMEAVFKISPRDQIYAKTGIQFMQLNTLYQLFSMVKDKSSALSSAESLLNMPDLFNFFLTGRKANEFTISSTTQCYNPTKKNWDFDTLTQLGIPTKIFGEIVAPGTLLGKLRPSIAQEICYSTSVIAGAGHDTACAIAAVPASTENYIYLSSGTWSLMGVLLDRPLINAESLAAEMTNEGGVDGKIRFLKNIVGLWLVQECRRQWAREGKKYSYADLTKMAAKAHPYSSLIIPGKSRFMSPKNMADEIQASCRENGQTVPETKGAIIRTVLESLALEYRWVAKQIDRLTGKRYPLIHIIGGGTQNKLLNQFTASATGKTVVSGPVEATAIGNILIQAIAMGEIFSLSEGQAIVKSSFDVETYRPKHQSAWDQAYSRYKNLKVDFKE
ncbi:MAG: rhamnulokinase [Anaerolineae bacterium]|nr:rhamnulokinase [Anaerolineae bacterium]